MNHFTFKFWLLMAFVAAVILLMGNRVASAQTPPPENERILTGVVGCALSGPEPRDCPMALHYLKLNAGTMYAIDMHDADFTGGLTLEDLFGNVLATDMDYYDDLYGIIMFTPNTSGEYRLTVESKSATPGFYNVRVREMPMVMNVANELTSNNPMAHDAFMSVQTLSMTAGQRYVIDLRSDEFNTFLKVLDPQGVVVAFADEGDCTRTRRVVFTPTRTATYHIVATSTDPATIGAFRLLVCEK